MLTPRRQQGSFLQKGTSNPVALGPSSGSRIRFSISINLRRAKKAKEECRGHTPKKHRREHASDSVASGNQMAGETEAAGMEGSG